MIDKWIDRVSTVASIALMSAGLCILMIGLYVGNDIIQIKGLAFLIWGSLKR